MDNAATDELWNSAAEESRRHRLENGAGSRAELARFYFLRKRWLRHREVLAVGALILLLIAAAWLSLVWPVFASPAG